MNILVLPGDDIGPEITAAALAVLGPCSLGGNTGTCAFGAAVVTDPEKSAQRVPQTA